MDAVAFAMESQYGEKMLGRELNKANAGFQRTEADPAPGEMPRVATGQWGCGVFGGDVEFKSLIQWAAASSSGRCIEYFPFGLAHVAADLPVVTNLVMGSRHNSVGALCKMLRRYKNEHKEAKHSELMVADLTYDADGLEGTEERHQSVFEFVVDVVQSNKDVIDYVLTNDVLCSDMIDQKGRNCQWCKCALQ